MLLEQLAPRLLSKQILFGGTENTQQQIPTWNGNKQIGVSEKILVVGRQCITALIVQVNLLSAGKLFDGTVFWDSELWSWALSHSAVIQFGCQGSFLVWACILIRILSARAGIETLLGRHSWGGMLCVLYEVFQRQILGRSCSFQPLRGCSGMVSGRSSACFALVFYARLSLMSSEVWTVALEAQLTFSESSSFLISMPIHCQGYGCSRCSQRCWH